MDDNKNKDCTVQFEPSGLKVKVTLVQHCWKLPIEREYTLAVSAEGMDTVENAKLLLTKASSTADLLHF